MEFQSQLVEQLKLLDTRAYLERLAALKGDPRIEARAQAELEAIQKETLESVETSTEREETEAFVADVLRKSGGSALNATVTLLAEPQRKNAIERYVKWFWNVAGLRKPYGLLAGSVRGRRNWRYAISDDLLSVLVQLAMVEDPSGVLQNVTLSRQIRLRDFLAFLEDRFGVIVDRPPAFLDTASTRAAAQENLEALRRRLRQMGYFRALSDDFTAQYLHSTPHQEAN